MNQWAPFLDNYLAIKRRQVADDLRRSKPLFDHLCESLRPHREAQLLQAFDDGIPRAWIS